jgi:cytochrome c2
MMKPNVARIALVLLTAGAATAAAYGGWATITVENLPDNLVAGQPYNLTFSVRQHGHDLLGDLSPRVELRSGERDLVARAVATNKKGFYTATLNVPAAGDWSATIQSGFGKSRLDLMPMIALDAGARRAVTYNAHDQGQRLFVAKGCMSCHEHARVQNSGIYQVGPSLTTARFEHTYLRKFLKDPSIKPATTQERMPNLNLSDRDVEALVAFLNDSRPVRAASGGR